MLGVYGGEGGEVGAIKDVQAEFGRGEWLFYQGLPAEFIDEGTDGFDYPAADDALDRVVAFLDAHVAQAADG